MRVINYQWLVAKRTLTASLTFRIEQRSIANEAPLQGQSSTGHVGIHDDWHNKPRPGPKSLAHDCGWSRDHVTRFLTGRPCQRDW